VSLGSFHRSAGIVEPLVESKVTRLEDMGGASSSHMFPDTMMYWYAKRSIFTKDKTFFDHKVGLYVRFNPDQLSKLKSCQLQVGLINDAAFRLIAKPVKEDRRLFDKFPYILSKSFCWKPANFLPKFDGTATLAQEAPI